jgi:non-homologous end joining protein Ku
MNKQNFDAMSKAELRAYVIAHQDDQEAFYALADRLTSKPPTATYPASMTPDEIQKAILEIINQKRKSQDSETTA